MSLKNNLIMVIDNLLLKEIKYEKEAYKELQSDYHRGRLEAFLLVQSIMEHRHLLAKYEE